MAPLTRFEQRIATVGLFLALGACVPSGIMIREPAPSPPFDPITFFTGTTIGLGSLKVITKHPQPTTVNGHGVVTADGAMVLDQDVSRESGKPSHRTWQLHPVGPGRYAGTLTDAAGPVAGEVVGNRLHLAFPMKGGLRAQQWLYLQPGGQIARNRMVVTKFGLPVASLDETIRRVAE